jgi:hypothetical protein
MVSHWSCAELGNQGSPGRHKGVRTLGWVVIDDDELVVLVQVFFRFIMDLSVDCKN